MSEVETVEAVEEVEPAPKRTRKPKPTVNYRDVFETIEAAKEAPPQAEETRDETIEDAKGNKTTTKVKTGNLLACDDFSLYKLTSSKDEAYSKFCFARNGDQALAILAENGSYGAEIAEPKTRGRAKKIDAIYLAYATGAVVANDKPTLVAFLEVHPHYKEHLIETGVMPADFV